MLKTATAQKISVAFSNDDEERAVTETANPKTEINAARAAKENLDRVAEDQRDRKQANAYRDMEGAICDCVNMAGITTAFINDSLFHIRRGIIPGHSELEQITFAVFHLEDLINKLKTEYYEEY